MQRPRAKLLVVLIVACGGGQAPTARHAEPTAQIEAPPPPPPVAPDLTVGEDVTEAMRAKNSNDYAPPPDVFRRIETHPIDKPQPQRTDKGYEIQLPRRAPVITPTLYRDLMVTGGGFRSREMYAFRATDGEPVWAIGLGDDGPSNAACEDRVCVFNTESCTIFAVDAATGDLRWSYYLGDPLMSAPTIANGLVFAAYPASSGQRSQTTDRTPPPGMTHALAAFDLQSGELKWTKWIDADVISAPVAIVDSVYVSTFAGTVFKLDQQSGEIQSARAARATSAPSWVDGALYFSHRADENDESAHESLVRSEKGSGKPGDSPARESARRPAAHIDSTVQSATQYQQESAQHDAANGFGGGAPASANAAVARRLVGRGSVHGLQEYQGSWVLGLGNGNYSAMGNALVSFDRQSGQERWSLELEREDNANRVGGAMGTPPAAAGDRLVLGTVSGDVLVVESESGTIDERISVGSPLRTQPVVHRGWIWVGTADGKLIAVNTGNERLTGWPTWAGNAARTGAGAN